MTPKTPAGCSCFRFIATLFAVWTSSCLWPSAPAQAEPRWEKLDVRLQAILAAGPAALTKPFFRNDSADVIIRASDTGVLRTAGFSIHAISRTIATAKISFTQIEGLSLMAAVEMIEAASVCRPALDVSIPEIGADAVWQGFGGGYRGAGVIVGIADSGIDWSHSDFINSNGTSRILYLWDQTDNKGPHPSGTTYGTMYTQAQINNELDGIPAGVVKEKDINGHGTHVAGIAAGNGRATGNGKPSEWYKGVAPESDLIIVKSGDDSFMSSHILDGIEFIFTKAKELNRPAAVNISLGSQSGPHDGTSGFEQGIDDLLWEKGRAVVVAAGNNGDEGIHFQNTFTTLFQDSRGETAFQFNLNEAGVSDYVYFDLWYPPLANLSISVVTPSNVSKGPVPSGSRQEWRTSEGSIVVINATSGTNASNGDREVAIQLSDTYVNGNKNDDMAKGTWKIVMTGRVGRIDGWLYGSSVDARITSETDYSTLLIEPANSRRVIAVAAYASRASWPSLYADSWGPGAMTLGNLCDFSSPGPTRANSLNSNPNGKPELSAPGEYILSSMSSQMESLPDDRWRASDGKHIAFRGTSMAAPHVTGLAALMFQANPQASVSEIRARLIETARHDGFTGLGWNKSYGYGKADAYNAVKKMTPVSSGGKDRPEGYALLENFPNPFNGSTTIVFTPPAGGNGRTALEILDISGRIMKTFSPGAEGSGFIRWSWDGRDHLGKDMPSGVYFVRLSTKDGFWSRKLMLIR
jgi:subtilisin family serine protease